MHNITELMKHLGELDVDIYVFGHDELCEPTGKRHGIMDKTDGRIKRFVLRTMRIELTTRRNLLVMNYLLYKVLLMKILWMIKLTTFRIG